MKFKIIDYIIYLILFSNTIFSKDDQLIKLENKTSILIFRIFTGILFMLIGLITSVFGKKLFKRLLFFITLFFISSLINKITNSILSEENNTYNHKVRIILFWFSITFGTILGFSSYFSKIIRLNILFICNTIIINNIFIKGFNINNVLFICILLLPSMLISLIIYVKLNNENNYYIISTSFIGSYMFFSGLDEFCNVGLSHRNVFSKNPEEIILWKIWLFIFSFLILFIITAYIQFKSFKGYKYSNYEKADSISSSDKIDSEKDNINDEDFAIADDINIYNIQNLESNNLINDNNQLIMEQNDQAFENVGVESFDNNKVFNEYDISPEINAFGDTKNKI